jgi:predicted exporter
VRVKEQTQAEAQWLGTIASVAMIALMLVSYRGSRRCCWARLPLLSAGLAGLGAWRCCSAACTASRSHSGSR